MLPHPVWRAEQEVTAFWTSPLNSASQETPFRQKRHRTINKLQANTVTSCFASETGSDSIMDFTIVFSIRRNAFLQYLACSAFRSPVGGSVSAVLPFYSTGQMRDNS